MGKKNKKKRLESIYIEKKEREREDILTFILKKVVFFSILFALVAPLVISRSMFFPFVAPKSIYFMFFAQISFFSWLVLVVHNRNFLPKKNIVFISLSIYIFILFLSSIFGVNFQESFWSNYERMTGFLMHLHLFGFFIAATSVFKRKEWNIVFSFTVIIASIISLISLYDRFIGIDTIEFRGGATFGSTSFMATYLLFNAFVAIYLFFENKKNIYKYIGAVNFIIISLGIIYNTRGRAVFVSFFSSIILLFFLWLFFEKKGFLRVLSAIVLFMGLVIFIAGFSIVVNPNSQFSESMLEKFNLGTIGGRTIIWDISIKGFLDRPFLGWGPKNFYLAFHKYYNPCLTTSRCGGETLFDDAHNFWHENLVTTGIVGSIAYLFLIFSVLFFIWRRYFKKKSNFFEAGIFTSLFSAYLVQDLTVFNMIGSLLMLFLIIAFISGLSKEEENLSEKSFLPVKKPNFFIITFIFILFAFYLNYFIVGPYKANKFILAGYRKETNIERRLEILDKAIYTSPLGRGHTRKHLARVSLSKEEINFNELKEIEFFINELSGEIKRSSFDYSAHVILGRLYLKNVNILISLDELKGEGISEEVMNLARENINEAEIILEKALQLSKENQEVHFYLAEAKVRQGKIEEAVLLAQKAVDLEPNILNSHLYLIRIIKDALNDKELAFEKAREAKKINPQWDFTPLFQENINDNI